MGAWCSTVLNANVSARSRAALACVRSALEPSEPSTDRARDLAWRVLRRVVTRRAHGHDVEIRDRAPGPIDDGRRVAHALAVEREQQLLDFECLRQPLAMRVMTAMTSAGSPSIGISRGHCSIGRRDAASGYGA